MAAPFQLTEQPIAVDALRGCLSDPGCGAYVAFEGWVRNHHGGRAVATLRYEAYPRLAVAEGACVVAEAEARFPGVRAACIHRLGTLAIGDLAVLAAASAPHRDEAFAACRFLIDAVKARVPIWKHERYLDGTVAWVEGCHPSQRNAPR